MLKKNISIYNGTHIYFITVPIISISISIISIMYNGNNHNIVINITFHQ